MPRDRWITDNGYVDLRQVGQDLCAIRPFLLTTALLVGLDATGYRRRYCFEHAADARESLLRWDGTGHPPGPWIKCKGDCGDILNPAWTRVGQAVAATWGSAATGNKQAKPERAPPASQRSAWRSGQARSEYERRSITETSAHDPALQDRS